MFQLMDSSGPNAVIRVIGIGGGGNNAVRQMVDANIDGVNFICANTDAQALQSCDGATTLQMGANVTKGLGAGANPEVGRQSALEDRDSITAALDGADMVFITPVWAVVPAPAPPRWWRRSPRIWVCSPWRWSPGHFPLKVAAACRWPTPASRSWASMWIR